MDPIHPIAPGPPRISPAARLPVEPLERISRERDRPSKDAQQRPRREPPPAPEPERDPDDGEHPHVDVRA
ncbi:MAG: hypothetical protein ABSB69_08495 [Solirubrobacteraceae bacterium]